jgi:hypothetical protein
MTLAAIKKHYPHLWRVLMDFNADNPAKGACFHRGVALTLDMPLAKLCIGTLREATDEEQRTIKGASTEPFIHCWVEVRETVYAPTTIEAAGELVAWPKDEYYSKNGVRDVTRASRRTILQLSKKHAWSSHMLRDKPHKLAAPLGGVLLIELGIRHKVNGGGGIIPD